MDIESEKLRLIEQLTKLQDVRIIEQVKRILDETNKVKVVGSEPSGQKITQANLIERAEASNQAIKEGKVTSIEDLEEESKSW